MQIKYDHFFVKAEKPYEEVMQQLISEAAEIRSRQEDYVVQGVKYSDDNSIVFSADGIQKSMDVTEFAFGQYCSKIGMPIAFYNRLSREPSIELQNMALENINVLAKHHHKKMLLRTNQNVVRGVLSTKYTPFDTHRILEILDHEMRSNPLIRPEDLIIRGHVNNPDIFHMRVTSIEPIKAKGVENGIYTGLSIDTSNVGKSKIAVNFFLYRQVCSNGMVVAYFNKNLFSQKHMNISESEIAEGLQYSFSIYPQIARKAEEMVIQASSTNISKELLEYTNNDFRKETIKNKLNVSDQDMEIITNILRDKYPPTVWGYTNAITEFSKTKDFERRIELERLAGDLLHDPNRYALVA